MNLSVFLNDLSDRKIKVWVADGKLRFKAPKGAMTDDIKKTLKARKPDLIRMLSPEETAVAPPLLPPMLASAETDIAPLTFAQARMVFLNQIAPEDPRYNMPVAHDYRGLLDVAVLENALEQITERQESLRTTFLERNGDFYAQVRPAEPLELTVIDLGGLESNAREELLATKLTREARLIFDLEQGPLFRCRLFRLDDDHHCFLENTHHSIGDGWSLSVFFRELQHFYGAHFSEQESLPPLSLQCRDVAFWQREHFKGPVLDKLMDYWSNELDGFEPRLDLPVDRAEKTLERHGDLWTFYFDEQLSRQLRHASQRFDASPFMSLAALYGLLLYHACGQSDVVMGTPVSGRDHGPVENLIGLFVNTLVLRLKMDTKQSFEQAIQLARDVCLNAFTHGAAPFELLAEKLRPEGLQDGDLFQTLFSLQNASDHRPKFGGLQIEPRQIHREVALYPLQLEFQDLGDRFFGYFEYDRNLFDQATIAMLASGLELLAKQFLETPDKPLEAYSLVDKRTRQQLLTDWGDGGGTYSESVSIPDLLLAIKGRFPDTTAIVAHESNQALTYGALWNRAEQLAHYLLKAGIRPEQPVAMLTDRNPEAVVAKLGILMAGGCYVPLDPNSPIERLGFILEDIEPLLILSEAHLRSKLPTGDWRIENLDLNVLSAPDNEETLPTIDENTLAYMMFTSGSTGRPKGVAIPHRGVARLCHDVQFASPEHGKRIAQTGSLAFDLSTLEIYLALTHGSTLVIIDSDNLLSAHSVSQIIQYQCVNHLDLTAALFHAFAHMQPDMFRSLDWLGFGGESLDHRAATAVIESAPPARMRNTYGPTECTVFSTFYEIDRKPEGDVPIGRPVQHTRVCVVNNRLQLLPPGIPGELCLGGPKLARGYFGKPAQTAAAFIPDPFSGRTGERLYRTGDTARWNHHGQIEFKGREDFQIKLRGIRMEPGEIEAHLQSVPTVKQAVVMLKQDPSKGTKVLAAFIVPSQPDTSLDLDEIKRELGLHLPDAMIPQWFSVLPKLPLTVNGKVDRKVLEKIASRRDEHSNQISQAASTELEKQLTHLWCEVLSLESANLTDSFFDSGGHSLKAMRLMSRIGAVFGFKPPLRGFFENPTIDFLVKSIQAQTRIPSQKKNITKRDLSRQRQTNPLDRAIQALCSEYLGITPPKLDHDLSQYPVERLNRLVTAISSSLKVSVSLTDLNTGPTPSSLSTLVLERQFADTIIARPGNTPVQLRPEPRLPLTPRQRRLFRNLHADRLLPMVHCSAVITDALDFELLAHALDQAAACHTILKTYFPSEHGETWQRLATRPPSLELAEDQTVSIDRPFDWNSEPPWRAVLVADGSDRSKINLILHPLLADTASAALLFRQWWQAYEKMAQVGEAESLTPALPYNDIAVWQQRQANHGLFDEQQAFWSRELSNPPRLAFKTKKQTDIDHANLSEPVTFTIKSELASRLKQLSNHLGLDDLLTALLHVLLTRQRRTKETVIGTFHDGRQQKQLRNVIGPLESRFVLRLALPVEKGLLACANTVKTIRKKALQNADVSFDDMVPLLDRGETGLVSMWLRVWSPRNESHPFPVLEPGGRMGSQPELTLVSTQAGAVNGFLHYDRTRFDAEQMLHFCESFVRLIDAASADPRSDLRHQGVQLENEHKLQLRQWNPPTLPLPEPADPASITAAIASKSPDRIAVVDTTTEAAAFLTYGAMHRKALRVSWQLRQEGVGVNDAVGVQIARSQDMIVSMLAVLYAGAGYLPLDPNVPEERLAYMLADSGATTVLTLDEQVVPSENVDIRFRSLQALADQTCPETTRPVLVPDSAMAYIMYTSGSTGKPKGTVITRRNIARLITGKSYVAFHPDRVIAQAASAAFDAATFEIWAALTHGARTVILPLNDILEGDVLHAKLVAQAVDTMFLTTALFNNLAEYPGIFRTLEYLYFGGEAANIPAIRKALPDGPEYLGNIYGPTESTTFASFWLIDDVILDDDTTPIGLPIDNTSLYVVDRELQLCPHQEDGELVIGGEGLASSYHRRPSLTAEKFIPDPFSDQPGARLYRSGDLVYRLEQGEVVFRGRIDNQVKIRGYRIELGEIKAAIEAVDHIDSAYVTVLSDQGSEKSIAAYFVSDTNTTSQQLKEQIKQALSERLPTYMLPHHLIQLEAFPLNSNGKVDRHALPAPGEEEAPPPALSTVRNTLATIWQDVLGVKAIQPTDNFFQLGGHSLMLMQVEMRVRSALGVSISVRDLFNYAVFDDLVSKLENSSQGQVLPTSIMVTKADGYNQAPCSFPQRRAFFMDRLAPNNVPFNIPYAFYLHGPFCLNTFHEALALICNRHESLRTTFAINEDGEAIQIVQEQLNPGENYVDLGHLAREHQTQFVKDIFLGENLRPFNLDHGPLLRSIILRLNDSCHAVILTIHHIIADGWSLSILLQELDAFYAFVLLDKDVDLPELTVQYPDYALWLQESVNEPWQQDASNYWKTKLAGDLSILPTLKPRVEKVTHRGRQINFTIPHETTEILESLAQSTGTTLFMVLLTGFKLVLRRYTGEDDILTGTPTANRESPETEALIGFFVNTVVLRTNLEGVVSYREALERVRESVLDAFDHQRYPFDDLVRELAPKRDNRYSPIFQTMFSMINLDVSEPHFTGCKYESIPHVSDTALFDLSLALQNLEGVIYGALSFNTSHFEEDGVQALIDNLTDTLKALANTPENNPQEQVLAMDRSRLHWIEAEAKEPVTAKSWQSPSGLVIDLDMVEAMMAVLPEIEQVNIDRAAIQIGKPLAHARIVPSASFKGDEKTLQSILKARIPQDFMPEVISLDKTTISNGPEFTKLGETEQLVIAIWRELLPGQTIGIDDNFFELGGHSLMLMRVELRLRQHFGSKTPIKDLFTYATPRTLAEYLDTRHAGKTEVNRKEANSPDHGKPDVVLDDLSIPIVSRDQPIPCSSPQLRAFFRDRLAPNQIPFNIPFAFDVHGPLDLVLVERALYALTQRHESLRTTFATDSGGQAVQVIHEQMVPESCVIDFRDLSGKTAEEHARQRCFAELYRPFNMDHGPLFRYVVLLLETNRQMFCLNTHHIVSDGWSMSTLTREFRDLYQAELENRSADLESLPIQYADYAAWQVDNLSSDRQQEASRFWHEQLASDHPVLPTDMPRSGDEIQPGQQIEIRLDAETTSALKTLAFDQHVSLFMVLLTAVKLTLKRYSNLDDIIIGTPHANRERPETEPLIGFFINTLALRTNLHDVENFASALDNVRESTLASFAYQDYPFDHLVRDLALQRDPRYSPIFQTMFSFVNMPAASLSLPGCELEGIGMDGEFVNYDFTIAMQELDGEILGVLVYKQRHFHEKTAEALVHYMKGLLQSAARDIQTPLSDIPFDLSEAELHDLFHLNSGHPTPPAQKQTRVKTLLKTPAGQSAEQKTHQVKPEATNDPVKPVSSKPLVEPVPSPTKTKHLPVGMPFDGFTHYLLNRHNDLVPLGVEGELCIGGESVARGYMDDPRRTADRFTPDPFHNVPGSRIYRTGDLAFYQEDGDLVFIGRRDYQIKIHGYRIEPGEIEAKLLDIDEVKEALVTTYLTEGGQKRLVAYLVLHEGIEPGDTWNRAIRSRIVDNLPAYMLPTIVSMHAFPTTPNNKIDRKALPQPEHNVTEDYLAPKNRMEIAITRIWEEALEISPISADDNFFEIGGHSMLSLRVSAMIEAQLGQTLPIAVLLAKPTIAGLAEWLSAEVEPEDWTPVVTINDHGSGTPLFLVHPVSGNVTRYVHLGQSFSGERPVYAIEAPGLDDRTEAVDSMDTLVHTYLSAIREIQPTGPYLLGGWSLGGVIAAEIANQLLAAGEEVGPLVLIESFTQICNREQPEHEILAAFAMDLGGQAGNPLPIDADAFFQSEPEAAMNMIFAALKEIGSGLAANETRLRDMYRVFRSNMIAVGNHRPSPPPDNVLLITATGDEYQARDPAMAEQGWHDYGFATERHDLAGNHYSLLDRENVHLTSSIIRQTLSKWQT